MKNTSLKKISNGYGCSYIKLKNSDIDKNLKKSFL